MASANYKKPYVYFLQAMMNRGIISKNDSLKLCSKFYEIEDGAF